MKPGRLTWTLPIWVVIATLWPTSSFAVQLRLKCGSVTADSCNDWYYTAGLNGAPHVPAGNAADYYLGYTGSFARRYVVNFPSISIPQNATIDSGYLKACWVTTDSTIKPIIYMYGVASDAIDTIVDSARWVTGYNARTAAVDSMYDSLWARSTTAFGWAKTFNIKNILQELVNSAWWQSGDTAVFVAIPKSGTTGDRYFKQLNSNGGGDSLIIFYSPPSGGGSESGPRVLIRK